MKLRTPGIWAIVTALFFLLILLLSLLLVYTQPPQLTALDFAQMDSQYENCTILSQMQQDELHCYLVSTQSGEVHLIPTRQHAVLPSRWKVCKNNILSIAEPDAEQTVDLKINFQTNTVTLSGGQIQNVTPAMLLHTQADMTVYIIISGLLAYLVLFIVDKIRGYA